MFYLKPRFLARFFVRFFVRFLAGSASVLPNTLPVFRSFIRVSGES
jgi:hypothetical protein